VADSLRIAHAGKTDVGKKRGHNEDAWFVMEDERLFLVADGMGGHSSGEVASQLACDTVASFFRATSTDEEITWPFKMEKGRNYAENRLITGIKLANQRIFEASQREARYKGMGTTIVGAHMVDGCVCIAHVGDSRVYQLREGRLQQLTEDHSLLNDYLKARQLTEEEIENFPHKNVIVRALGMRDSVQVDVKAFTPRVGDVYILCSDGLSGMVDDQHILDIALGNVTDLGAVCEKLVEAANEAGGHDNVTTVCIRLLDE
jgi:protein phosphatase